MHRRIMAALAALSLLASLLIIAPFAVAAGGSGTARHILLSGTGSLTTGGFTPNGDVSPEFPAQEDEPGTAAYNGIVDRTLSTGTGHGASTNSTKKAKSNPTFQGGFEGLNLFQQRYARGGNQFSVEPPDQGLCVGNGYVVEAVNDVMNVFNSSGHSCFPTTPRRTSSRGFPRNVNHAVDLNSFYGYAPAINRSTGVRGPVRDRPELPLRRGDASLLPRRADARDVPERCVHDRQPPGPRGQQDGESDRQLEHLPHRCHQRRLPRQHRRARARASATTRTSAPTRTAST